MKNKNIKGSLEVICGSMFSGKSYELIRRLKRAQIAQLSTYAFKHSFDNRITTEYVISHDGNKLKATSVCDALSIEDLTPLDAQVIGIDEAQFFSHELISVILNFIESGKKVIVAGLDLDFKSIPFGPIPTLMALADKVTKLSAVCMPCGQDAHFSQRLVNGIPAKYDDPIVFIGAQETYQARCRNCYQIDKKAIWQSTL